MNIIYEDFFALRLARLREQQKVSAREMSLALGQNESYINRIENGKAFPSMQAFFYICEYLKVSPKEFFDDEATNPVLINEIMFSLKNLSNEQLLTILNVTKGFHHTK